METSNNHCDKRTYKTKSQNNSNKDSTKHYKRNISKIRRSSSSLSVSSVSSSSDSSRSSSSRSSSNTSSSESSSSDSTSSSSTSSSSSIISRTSSSNSNNKRKRNNKTKSVNNKKSKKLILNNIKKSTLTTNKQNVTKIQDKRKVKEKQKGTEKILGPKPSKKKHTKQAVTPNVETELADKAKAMAPMTKEEWQKKQSIIRKVYDEETGRFRLIKGDGEVIEEIVSRERHKEINKQATRGDGTFFQSQLKSKTFQK
ncbi:ADP-ribosylation factor-like protein 6-interacting protein 4 isoform X1 [Prorops nasuta]|uniref:ADP-ribosylation factor-like protein 6-interacting protein 4 isoform X1 n=2 Tax=Prorops nasuta TaxID=863751 RepID=UPI0034CD2122